eukprot:581770-Rhodomonas_salina.2
MGDGRWFVEASWEDGAVRAVVMEGWPCCYCIPLGTRCYVRAECSSGMLIGHVLICGYDAAGRVGMLIGNVGMVVPGAGDEDQREGDSLTADHDPGPTRIMIPILVRTRASSYLFYTDTSAMPARKGHAYMHTRASTAMQYALKAATTELGQTKTFWKSSQVKSLLVLPAFSGSDLGSLQLG